MKKLILFFALSFSIAAKLSAQDFEYIEEPQRKQIDFRKARFGIFLAPNISWMKPTSAKSDDGFFRVSSDGSKVGYSWGLMVDYYFAENYGISTGIQVNTSGGNIKIASVDSNTFANTVQTASFKYSLQYLEVPFNLKLRTDEIASANGLQVFGQLGLTAGINIGKRATYEVAYRDANGNHKSISGEREKLTGSFTIAPVLLQLNVGAGVEKAVSEKMSVYFGMFFNNAFLPDVTNPAKYELPYPGSFSDGKIRMNNFAFRFGIFF